MAWPDPTPVLFSKGDWGRRAREAGKRKKYAEGMNDKMIHDVDIHRNPEELKRCVERFSEARLIVVGDIIMDEYIWGDVSRISPEAPVPVVDIQEETKMLGGAANVLNNIAALGGKAILCGLIGDDQMGQDIVDRMKEQGLRTDGIITESHRPTSVKTRVVAHNQQVVRFDRESRKKLEADSTERILDFIRQLQEGYEAIVVADYGKGVISAELMEGLRGQVSRSSAILAVDPKIGNFECYHKVDVITPNHHEAGAFCRTEIVDQESLVRAGNQMLRELDCRYVLITRGKDGMSLFENGGEISHIPTVARKVYDVTGAGDTVISAFCLGLASGLDPKSAALISNFAAGIVVGEVGTSTVKAEDLKKVFNNPLTV
jgi:rfaE bifunctional protein kinase chain/domain